MHCYSDGKSHVHCEETTMFGRLLMMDSVQNTCKTVRMDEPSPFVVS